MGVIAQAALERATGSVVLDPKAPKRQDGPVIGVDRHLHVDLAVGLGQRDSYIVFDAEQRCGVFYVLVLTESVKEAAIPVRLPRVREGAEGRCSRWL